MFTYYWNDYIYILTCWPVGWPVDLYILYSNFTWKSILCSLFHDFTHILCVNHYVDRSTRTCYVVISYIHQLLLVIRRFHIHLYMSTGMSTSWLVDVDWVDWSMSTGLTGSTNLHFLLHNTTYQSDGLQLPSIGSCLLLLALVAGQKTKSTT